MYMRLNWSFWKGYQPQENHVPTTLYVCYIRRVGSKHQPYVHHAFYFPHGYGSMLIVGSFAETNTSLLGIYTIVYFGTLYAYRMSLRYPHMYWMFTKTSDQEGITALPRGCYRYNHIFDQCCWACHSMVANKMAIHQEWQNTRYHLHCRFLLPSMVSFDQHFQFILCVRSGWRPPCKDFILSYDVFKFSVIHQSIDMAMFSFMAPTFATRDGITNIIMGCRDWWAVATTWN